MMPIHETDLNSPFPIPHSELPAKGRLLGVDFGTVRVGLAACDIDHIVASPMSTYTRRTEQKDIEYFHRVVLNEQIVGLVVGLPISLNDTEGPKAKEARDYGAWLASITKLPLTFWDERFTSVIAEDTMREAGLSPQKRKDKQDRVAAQIMLQAFLNAQLK
jgi:putative holliday junction resolvase